MVNDLNSNWQETPFPGKHEGEQFQFFFRQHWIRMLRPFSRYLLSLAAIIGVGYVSVGLLELDASTRHLGLVVLLLLFILTNLIFLASLYRYFLYVIIVTDRKVHRIKKTLLATNDHQSIELWGVQDIFKSQHGIMQNLFGFGTIIMEAQDTQFRIHFIPGIEEKYQALMRMREHARAAFPGLQTQRNTTPVKADL